MKRFHNILFVSNGIDDVTESIKQALKLANDNNAKLSVLIVCPPFPDHMGAYKKTYENALTEQMEKTVQAARSALKISQQKQPVKIDLETGRALDVRIIRYVLQHAHDLVMKHAEVGDSTKGFKALDMELLRKCPCALFLSKSFRHSQKNARVAVAIDPNDEEPEGRNLSLNLLEISHSLSQNYSGNLDVISCWHFVFEEYLRDSVWVTTSEQELNKLVNDEKEGALGKLKALMKEAKVRDKTHEIHLLKGRPEDKIPAFVHENKTDLLVMGTVARTGIKGFIMGNTAENILQKLECSLLALKPQGFVSPVASY